ADKDSDERQQNMVHGLFHRIQPELGLITEDGFNEHLDTLEGRVWMQLEWRALRRAVESTGSRRAEAIADALAFRHERRRRFPGAAEGERREECLPRVEEPATPPAPSSFRAPAPCFFTISPNPVDGAASRPTAASCAPAMGPHCPCRLPER